MMSRSRSGVAPLLVMAWLVAVPSGAQETASRDEPVAHEEGGSGHEELQHRNAFGLVVGGTYESEEEDTFFTIGVEYERVIKPRFAVLFEVEHISEIDAWVVAAPFVYRHRSGLRLLAGPGLEVKTRRRPSMQGEGGFEGRKEENLFLMRFGALYNVQLGKSKTIAPTLNLDYVREDGHWVEALVLAVTFGFEF